MQCPYCQSAATRVVDSRSADQGAAVRRRRSCQECDQRFTTYERASIVTMVKKRSGDIEAFSAEKLRRGVVNALADRSVPAGSVDALVRDIEREMLGHPSVTVDTVGAMVLTRLRVLDEVAAVRFASVYKEFQGAADFGREVAELEDAARTTP